MQVALGFQVMLSVRNLRQKDIQTPGIWSHPESEGMACKQSITRTDFKPLPAQVHYIFAIPLCHPQSIRGMSRDDAQVSLHPPCNCFLGHGVIFVPAIGLGWIRRNCLGYLFQASQIISNCFFQVLFVWDKGWLFTSNTRWKGIETILYSWSKLMLLVYQSRGSVMGQIVTEWFDWNGIDH